MTKPNLKCWICGGDASSGEHKTKKTDLLSVFGKWTQANPLYYHDADRANQLVRGPKSDVLKSPSLICAHCNNERTQPHDRAWEVMSSWFRQNLPAMPTGSVVRATRIFPYDTKRQMLNVHLFFLKLFGCALLEAAGKIPIDLEPFASAIMRGRAHPDVYLKFGHGPAIVGRANLRNEQTSDKTHQIAGWSYLLDGFEVQVLFAKSIASIISEWVKATHAWHPRLGTNKLIVADYR